MADKINENKMRNAKPSPVKITKPVNKIKSNDSKSTVRKNPELKTKSIYNSFSNNTVNSYKNVQNLNKENVLHENKSDDQVVINNLFSFNGSDVLQFVKKRWILLLVALLVLIALVYFLFFRSLSPSEVNDRIKNTTFTIFFSDQYKEQGGEGTGILIGSNGLALTAFHCVNMYNGTYTAQFNDGQTCSIDRLIAVDANLDLAIIKLNAVGFGHIGIKSNNPSVGSTVYAYGNSEGTGLTFSQGIISGIKEDFWGMPLLSHTSSISPGNSGGPLVDSRGNLVGINNSTLDYGTTQNLNYATLTSKLYKFVSENKNSKIGINDKHWGESFTKHNVVFLGTSLREKYRFYGEVTKDDFNGIGYEEDETTDGEAVYIVGDYKNGLPDGFIYKQKEDGSEYGFTTYFGAYKNEKPVGSVIEYGDELKYLTYDKKSKMNGYYLLLNEDGFVYGNMKNGKLDGYATVGTADGEYSSYKYVNGNRSSYSGLLPLLDQKDIRYKVNSKGLVSIDWTPLPGAKYYAVYYKSEGGKYISIKEADNKKNTRIFEKPPCDEYGINFDIAAPLQNLKTSGNAFSLIVVPLTKKSDVKKYTNEKLSKEAVSSKTRIVYYNPLKLSGSYYEIYTSNKYAYPYTYDFAVDLGSSNFLGNATTDINDDYSVFNKFGFFGNDYSKRSIFNKNGIYGSLKSDYSCYNPKANNPPKLYTGGGAFVCYLTKNKKFKNRIDPDNLFTQLMAGS